MDNKDLKSLIEKYISEYNNVEHPFLLFDIARVNENDHTRVLLNILKYNNYQFLPSFLNLLGVNQKYEKITDPPTDQMKAIGNIGNGFIDLYFKYELQDHTTEQFIIENKIFGAGDTDSQLARYIATCINPKMDNDDFNNYLKIWTNGGNGDSGNVDYSHIHVVYLTSDGSKKPSLSSLPKYYGGREKDDADFNEQDMKINYYPVNYVANIIPWLENEVLPNMTYSDNGIAIAGMRQYIESLKAMFSSRGISETVRGYVNNIKKGDREKYKQIMEEMNVIKSLPERDKGNKDLKQLLKDDGYNVEDLPELQSLAQELRSCAMEIFANDGSELGGDWVLHFTPSFVILYKKSWAALDTRKYSIPSLNLGCESTDNFLNEGKFKTISAQVDHLSGINTSNFPNVTFVNHGKTARKVLDNGDIKCKNVNDKESRKKYYEDIIEKCKGTIELIDKAVEDLKNKQSINLQIELLKELENFSKNDTNSIENNPNQ